MRQLLSCFTTADPAMHQCNAMQVVPGRRVISVEVEDKHWANELMIELINQRTESVHIYIFLDRLIYTISSSWD